MSGRNNTAIAVRVNQNGKSYSPNGTGTTVAGVVAGGATLGFSGGCDPIPGPGLWEDARRAAARDPTIRSNPR
jgi:hypothetical protein